MQIKKIIKRFIKGNVSLRKLARKIYYAINKIRYSFMAKNIKVDDHLIVLACFNGRSYCDSPKALYEYLIHHQEYKNYKCIWAFEDVEAHNFLKKNNNTEIIDIKSKDYKKSLARAKYWIVNYKIQDYIFPKKEQIFVQCWHGTPLKRLGCDLEHFNNAMNSIEEIRKRYDIEASKIKYFLSPSAFASEKFITAWNLENSHKKDIILQEGYPRNDFLKNYKEEDINRIKEKLNLKNCKKKIILYAPTYRDNQHSVNIGYTYQTEVNFDLLKEKLEKDYIILFRAHWLVAQDFHFEKYKDFMIDVSRWDDINELYVIADLLITDYSSVFFDYANLKRPILFYMYDLKEYRDEIRGFYLNLEELPGDIVENEIDLIEKIIKQTSQFQYNEKYRKFNEKFNYLDDGQASKRVLDRILR